MKNYLKEYANQLISNGYTVIPVEGKRPHGKNWQHSRYTSYDDICQNLDDWSIDKSKNVGILCNRTQLIGVDIDVYDPVVANLMIVSTHSRLKAAEASSKNLMSSSLICLISLKSLKKTKNSITQPYSSLHHSSNILIVKEQS